MPSVPVGVEAGRALSARPSMAGEITRLLNVALAVLAFGLSQVRAAPAVTQFSPAMGAPGTLVTITGVGFVGVTEVLFNSLPASFAVVSATRITALVPPDATTGPITVNTLTSGGSSLSDFFVAPRLTAFFPAVGSPGDSITISGANFISGATTVKFGDKTASAEVTADTQIQAVVPTGAQTGPISVGTVAGTAASPTNFVVLGPGPFIQDFAPTQGRRGETIVIRGLKFTGVTAVKFNGVAAVFQVPADSQILATVPAGATTGPLSITGPGGTTFSETHFVVLGLAPVIEGFEPQSGPTGAVVTVTGRSFTGAASVSFGSAAAQFEVTADTQILATVPSDAQTGVITVRINAELVGTSAKAFVVTHGPTITSFTPDSGGAGDLVIISGTYFNGATAVKFGTVLATFEVTADTQIHATVPAGATSGPISVITAQGNAVSANQFVVLPPGPVVTGFVPAFGTTGTVVTVYGVHFTGATAVRLGDTEAAFEVTADSQIRVVVPASASTGPITVVTSGGSNATTNLFYVTPRIRSFAPASGGPGIQVWLLGANFTGASMVTFGGTNAQFAVASPGEIRAIVPESAQTGPITVTTPAGTAISTNDFVVSTAIVGFAPEAGPPGTSVRIWGTGFKGATTVLFGGGAEALFVVNAPDQITAIVPRDAITGPVIVVSPQGTAASAASFIVSASGDLAVSISDLPGPAIVRNPMAYTVVVTNSGPSDVSAVILTDRLPAGVELGLLSVSQGTYSEQGGLITWRLGSLAAGSGARGRCVVTPTAPGMLTNSVSVSGTEHDPALANNSAGVITEAHLPFRVNLVRNGDAEMQLPLETDPAVIRLPGWESTNQLQTIPYGLLPGLPTSTTLGPATRGARFFWGGQVAVDASASQRVEVGAGVVAIDTGGVLYEFAGYLGGIIDQNDHAAVGARFLGAAGETLGSAAIGPVTAADRTNTTALLLRSAQGRLPAGTRSVEFSLKMTVATGGANDGLADNLSFMLNTNDVLRLSIRRLGKSVLLSWPSEGTNFALESTPSLTLPLWTEITNRRETIDNQLVVTNTLPTGAGARFYRLFKP